MFVLFVSSYFFVVCFVRSYFVKETNKHNISIPKDIWKILVNKVWETREEECWKDPLNPHEVHNINKSVETLTHNDIQTKVAFLLFFFCLHFFVCCYSFDL